MGVGLGIRVFDILNVQEPFVTVGEGSVRVKGRSTPCQITLEPSLVEFRLVVFRPFRGEILQARIRSCTEEGVHGELTFNLHSIKDFLLGYQSSFIGFLYRYFNPTLLFTRSFRLVNTTLYTYKCLTMIYCSNREEQLWTWQCDGGEIYMDLEEEIRIRVVQETFTESNPNGAKAGQPDGANSEHKSPFALIVGFLHTMDQLTIHFVLISVP